MDPHHVSFFSFNADPDPTSAPNKSDASLRATSGLQTLYGSILILQVSLRTFTSLHGSILSLSLIVSVHVPPWLHFEPLKLLNFYFNADLDSDPDPTFHSNVDLASQNKADPDPQPCTQDIQQPCCHG
jgi:hypothetical protein